MAELSNEALNNITGGTAKGEAWSDDMGMTYYRVAAGDTLSDIAARFHTTVHTIAALNPALIEDINFIQVGWVLRVI